MRDGKWQLLECRPAWDGNPTHDDFIAYGWDRSPTERGDRWAARLEFQLTDPAVEPDMNNWQTQLAFKLRG